MCRFHKIAVGNRLEQVTTIGLNTLGMERKVSSVYSFLFICKKVSTQFAVSVVKIRFVGLTIPDRPFPTVEASKPVDWRLDRWIYGPNFLENVGRAKPKTTKTDLLIIVNGLKDSQIASYRRFCYSSDFKLHLFRLKRLH